MPLYNTAATLVESLESVYAQDFTDWELILFDDGSTDGTVELAQQAAHSYPEKVRFFQHQDKQNKGAAITRNCAFEKSLGELITFLDGDDLWLPGRLSAHIQELQNNPSAAMLWGPAEYFGDGMIAFEQPTGLPATARLYLPPKLAENFVLSSRGTPFPGATSIKRAVFQEVNGFEETLRRGEDIALWLKIAVRYPIFYDPRIFFRNRRHPGSSTARANASKIRHQWDLEYQRWLATLVYSEPLLQHLRPNVDGQYHMVAQNWAAQWPWPRSRVAVTKQLLRFPRLLRRRWWQWMLGLFLPFKLSRRVSGKIQTWLSRP